MFHRLLGFCSLALISFATLPAQADILFVNLNWSVEESDSIKAAAKATNERVLEFPNFQDPAIRANALAREKLARKITALNSKYYGLRSKTYGYGMLSRVFSQTYRKLIQEANALSAQVRALEKEQTKFKVTPITLDTISKKIESYDREGGEITALVISGHSTGSQFWGNNVYLKPDYVFNHVQKYPKVFRALDTIIFLACHTGETDKLIQWGEIIPNRARRLVLGFDGSAPSHFTTESHNIVSNALKTRRAFLDQAPAPEAVKSWFLSLDPKVRETVLSVLVNDWIGGSSSKLKFRSAATLAEDCEIGATMLTQGRESYRSYFQPITDAADVIPEDSPGSQLRIFYRALQKYSGACKKEFGKLGFFDLKSPMLMPTREQVVALIHFSNLQMAFMHERGDEVAAFNEALKKAGAKESILMSEKLKVGALRRSELYEQIFGLQTYISGLIKKYAKRPEKLEQAKKLAARAQEYQNLLWYLKDVPLAWITFE